MITFADLLIWFEKKEFIANSLVAPDAKQLQHKRCDLACMFSNKWIVFTINFERTRSFTPPTKWCVAKWWSREVGTKTRLILISSNLRDQRSMLIRRNFSYWEFRHSIEEDTQTNSIRCKKKSESDFFLVEWENRIMHMRLNSWNDLWNEKIHTERSHQKKKRRRIVNVRRKELAIG